MCVRRIGRLGVTVLRGGDFFCGGRSCVIYDRLGFMVRSGEVVLRFLQTSHQIFRGVGLPSY